MLKLEIRIFVFTYLLFLILIICNLYILLHRHAIIYFANRFRTFKKVASLWIQKIITYHNLRKKENYYLLSREMYNYIINVSNKKIFENTCDLIITLKRFYENLYFTNYYIQFSILFMRLRCFKYSSVLRCML